LTFRKPSVKLDIIKFFTAKTTMKSLTGAILLLAASGYAVAWSVGVSDGPPDGTVVILGFVGVAHFTLGLYFLFAKYKAKT